MEGFLDYITSIDPTFASRIEGASPAEIDRLERAAGGPLPPDYRVYLELMGRGDDVIFGMDDVVTSATGIADLYEESVHSGEISVPSDCVVFAVSGLSIEELYIERHPPHRVIQTDNDSKGRLWAASFRGYLYQRAFQRATAQRHHLILYGQDPKPRHQIAEALLEESGLTRLWFSDEVTLCYESPTDRIAVSQLEGDGVWVRISSHKLWRLWTLAFRFARGLPAHTSFFRG